MIFAAFFVVFQALLLAAHYVVYKTYITSFGVVGGAHLLIARAVFTALALSFPLATLLTARMHSSFGKVFYAIGATWLGTLYWLFIASVITWVVFALVRAIAPGMDVRFVGVVFGLVAIGVSVYGVWNSYQTKVRQVTVEIPNLPAAWYGKRAVLVADTHFGNVRGAAFSRAVASLINEQKPDVVLIPGDFYDGPPVDEAQMAKPFGEIKATHGVFLAPGNHEEYGNQRAFYDALTAAGVKVLNNKAVTIDGLQIVGITYSAGKKAETEESTLRELGVSAAVPSILIKHVPDHINAAEAAGVSLQVSGHTHVGQVYPFGLITKKIYGKFYYGLSRLEKTQVLTTSGAGTWGPPQRVGTHSEIVVITLK